MEESTKKIIVKISEPALKKYKLNNQQEVDFDELVEKITLAQARKALLECNEIARETKLPGMSLDDINAEIKAVREAKNNP
jgi:hypothetical protein